MKTNLERHSFRIAALFILLLAISATVLGVAPNEAKSKDIINATLDANATNITRQVVESWYASAASPEETEKAFSTLLDENVVWENIQPVQGVSDVLPWIGTYRGPEGVKESIATYMSLINVTDFRLIKVVVQGNQAVSLVREAGVFKSTGRAFESDVTSWIEVDTSNGTIVHWRGIWDPSGVIAATNKSEMNKTEITRQIVEVLYSGFSANAAEYENRSDILDDNIEWMVIQVNPFKESYIEGDNETLPWIGTFHGKNEIEKGGMIFWDYVNRSNQYLVKLYVHEDQAIGIVREEGVITKTGRTFTADVVTWLQLDTSKGKIIRWMSIYPASQVLPALQAPPESEVNGE